MRNALLVFLLLLAPAKLLADGKVFSHTTAFADPTIPDQRALICWSNGIERLVIDTRFVGGGTNFAWIVPLPSPPLIEEATTGIFPTLAFQLRPNVVHDPEAAFGFFIFFTAIAYLLIFVRVGGTPTISDMAACAIAALCFVTMHPGISLIVFLILSWLVYRIRRGLEKPWAILVAVLFGVLLSAMLLPALGTASRSVSLNDGIIELTQKRVGAFDTTTLSSKAPNALLNWLRDNQFEIPTNAAPTIADYEKKGWVFVAAKLRRDDPAVSTNSIHPLSFTFRSEQPVYPMRLTGSGGTELKVELYVFGPSRADADFFNTERCAATWFPETTYDRPTREKIPVIHPLLRQWAQGSQVATKLTTKLTPDQMQQDVFIRWTDFSPVQQTLYSSKGAVKKAADWSTGLLLALFLLGSAMIKIKRGGRHAIAKMIAVVAGISVFTFGIICVALPKTVVHSSKFPSMYARMTSQRLNLDALYEWTNSPPKSLDEARRIVSKIPKYVTNNLFLGGEIHEEDSPGNYIIRPATNGFEFIWFDANGGENKFD
jgi:Uncharacterized protein conserved in bacteria